MIGLMNIMAKGLERPTEADLVQAEQEMISKNAYMSKDEKLRKLQIRCCAYSVVMRRQKQRHLQIVQSQPRKTEEEILAEQEAEILRKQIAHDQEIASAIMGQGSIFSKVCLVAPETRQTSVVKYFLEDFPYEKKNTCLLLGGTGAGKTFGAIGFVCQQANSVRQTAFITAYKLSEAIVRKDFEGLDRLEKVQYLIIDDLGAEPEGYKGKDFIAHFENLFITRHQANRMTLITSNNTLEQFKQVYGDRVVSRLREAGTVFQSPDGDLRKR